MAKSLLAKEFLVLDSLDWYISIITHLPDDPFYSYYE